jgi:hypothetical protein|tara:strand:- start:308 stop:544 length:237 start_codon:yes stop_codon:yes gene_type:complete
MQYFILRKQKMFGKVEYDTEPKARRGYSTINEAITKKVALDTLKESNGVEYIIVNDGTPTESIIESMEEKKEDQVVNI